MPESHVDAVIFDMDGVLIDSAAVYERHWRDWAESHGLDREAPIAVHHGHPAAETIALVAPGLDARSEAAAYNRTLAEDAAADGVLVMPGARSTLAGLTEAAWAIATSAPRMMAERWLSLLDLPIPRVLVTVDDVDRGKPAPEPYLRAAELLGVAATDCLVIEDAPAGIASAKAAGATVLALLTTHPGSALAHADAMTVDLTSVVIAATSDGLAVEWVSEAASEDGLDDVDDPVIGVDDGDDPPAVEG